MSRFRRFGPVAAIAIALTFLTAAPATPRVDSSTCGGYDSPLCTKTTSCVGILWGRICTSKYTYWPPTEGNREITPS